MTNSLPAALRRDFDIAVGRLDPHPGGFESDCWVADESWFVKVWRDARPPTQLALLVELQEKGLPVPAPIPTKTGDFCASWNGRPYAMFPFIRGRPATDDDWREMANSLACLHTVQGIDLPAASMDEPAIAWLGQHLDHPWISDRANEVRLSIERLQRARERAETSAVPPVLCHRDYGGHNLLIDDGKVTAILDWEQAALAPREHDVWVAAEGNFTQAFLAEYGATGLDLDHIEFALLARALRDLAARVQQRVDRPGIETWGFRRIAKLDADLDVFRAFCS